MMRFGVLALLWAVAAVGSIAADVEGDGAELVLVRNGTPVASIVLATQPTKASQLAALEIQEHVRLITGATLPIVGEDADVSGARVFVGASRAAAAPTDFAAQEYAVLFRPQAVVLAGQDEPGGNAVRYWRADVPGAYDYLTWPGLFEAKGTLHAAYDFLEWCCGVRWFNQSEFGTDVPSEKTLAVAPRNVRRKPAFRYRDPGYGPVTMEHYDRESSLWTVRWSEPTPRFDRWLDLMYERGRRQPECAHPHRWLDYQRGRVFAFLTRRRCGGEPFKTNHSFYGWYDRFWRRNPAHEAAFVAHRPDWFAEGYPDEQLPPQLCYANPAVVAQAVADARGFFALPTAARRAATLGTDRFFPVVPMDNTSFCKCTRCSVFGPAERVHDEFSNGDHSTRVWTFVNEVATGLKQTHPEAMVSALAYSTYARRPPGMRIADNVAVQMALFPQAAANDPVGLATDDAILQEWADGRPLYLWLYGGLTTGHKPTVPMFPQQMFQLYPALVRKYRDAGVQGLFLNGIPQETDAYFLFSLIDDPGQDHEALVADYFQRMYGPEAGQTMREFYEAVAAIYSDPQHHPRGVTGPDLHFGVLGTAPRMRQLAALVELAERQLAGKPEPWRKRFAMFKFGTWEYLLNGRAAYEAAKVVRASESISLACPYVLGPGVGGDTEGIDWEDAQGFGGFRGWLKDDGDLSQRRIDARFIHDGTHLHVRFRERELAAAPGAGDTWELLVRRPGADEIRQLLVTAAGDVSGKVRAAKGAPQEWSTHGLLAESRVAGGVWTTTLAIPFAALPVAAGEPLFMNCRRIDPRGHDSPVLIATGNDFDAARTGALVSFDKPISAALAPPSAADLLLDWELTGTGTVLRDRSQHGNDGVVGGAATRGAAGVTLTGGDQYLEVPPLRGLDPAAATFTCWFKYPDADREGHLLILKQGDFEVRLGVPHRRLGFLFEPPGGPRAAVGPGGVELGPGAWHMLTLVNEGKRLLVYENGRLRETLSTQDFQPASIAAMPWRVGGEPKRSSHHTLLGTVGAVQVYGRTLSAGEVLAKYEQDRGKYLDR
jgi:hypothetical protein